MSDRALEKNDFIISIVRQEKYGKAIIPEGSFGIVSDILQADDIDVILLVNWFGCPGNKGRKDLCWAAWTKDVRLF